VDKEKVREMITAHSQAYFQVIRKLSEDELRIVLTHIVSQTLPVVLYSKDAKDVSRGISNVLATSLFFRVIDDEKFAQVLKNPNEKVQPSDEEKERINVLTSQVVQYLDVVLNQPPPTPSKIHIPTSIIQGSTNRN